MHSILTKYFSALTPVQLEQYKALYPLYNDWNNKINVISRQDIENLYERHILHSLAIAKITPLKAGSRILDVGSGGGFPGVPLAIMFPEVHFHLVDSVGKKLKVVNAIADELKLTNITTEHIRIEEHKLTYDFITGRAVTELSVFANWVKKNIKQKNNNAIPNGILYLKGGDISEELKNCGMKNYTYKISTLFDEEFFETKKVIHLY